MNVYYIILAVVLFLLLLKVFYDIFRAPLKEASIFNSGIQAGMLAGYYASSGDMEITYAQVLYKYMYRCCKAGDFSLEEAHGLLSAYGYTESQLKEFDELVEK